MSDDDRVWFSRPFKPTSWEEFDWTKAERCPNCGYPDYDDVQCHLCEGKLAVSDDQQDGEDDKEEQSPPDEPH